MSVVAGKRQKVARCLGKRRWPSLSAAQATESALGTAQVTVLADLVLPEPALAKDKRRQEVTAAEQCQADDKRFMVPVMPPNPVDATILCIWADYALRAAPLDAILAKIEREDIMHEA
jgi:hypothetical protein